MGKIKGFMLNRKQYNLIRKMDHCQMTLYVEFNLRNLDMRMEEAAKD